MESINAELVNVVGFPIAVCFALVWVIRDMNKNHKEVIQQFRSTIDHNTQALNLIVNRLDNKDRSK